MVFLLIDDFEPSKAGWECQIFGCVLMIKSCYWSLYSAGIYLPKVYNEIPDLHVKSADFIHCVSTLLTLTSKWRRWEINPPFVTFWVSYISGDCWSTNYGLSFSTISWLSQDSRLSTDINIKKYGLLTRTICDSLRDLVPFAQF